jgi:cytochrome P450
VPERFDFNQANNKWTLTTEGKPRNPLSFTPFMGGKRICLGKTFVDTSIRFTVPMLVYFLNFDFTNPKEQSTKKDYYSIGGQRELDMPMRITIRNKA